MKKAGMEAMYDFPEPVGSYAKITLLLAIIIFAAG